MMASEPVPAPRLSCRPAAFCEPAALPSEADHQGRPPRYRGLPVTQL